MSSDKEITLSQQYFSNRRSTKNIRTYWILRLLFGFIAYGYIHPDEFFQSQEVMAGTVFHLETYTPWEFDQTAPSRSSIFPFIIAGLPYSFLKLLPPLITSRIIFFLPRLTISLLSILSDCLLFRLIKHYKLDFEYLSYFLVFNTSSLLFYYRPFSNTMETFLVITIIFLTTSFYGKDNDVEPIANSNKFRNHYIGLALALGLFTRITFPIFVFPIFLFIFYYSNEKKKLFFDFIQILVSFLFFSFLFVVIDSLYFKKLLIYSNSVNITLSNFSLVFNLSSLSIKGHLIFPPLSNFLYNTSVENLARHGLHPFYTHLLVNIPLLFLSFIIAASMFIINNGFSSFLAHIEVRVKKITNLTFFYRLLISIIIFSLLILSLFPHQELRFILPLTAPFIMLFSQFIINSPYLKILKGFHIIFTIFLIGYFAFLQQGGVVPSLRILQSSTLALPDNIQTNIIYYKTYMPPRSLILSPQHEFRNISLNLVEINNYELLDEWINNKIQYNDFTFNYLVAPGSLTKEIRQLEHTHTFIENTRVIPHLSMEDPITEIAQMVLNIFSIK